MKAEISKSDMLPASKSFVSRAKGAKGIDLDYSPKSLTTVDEILLSFHKLDDQPDWLNSLLFTCGAYVGEVVRKHHAGKWVDVKELPEETRKNVAGVITNLPVVFDCNGMYISPYDKACKRVQNGAEDSIVHWANAATDKQFVPVEKPKRGIIAKLMRQSR
ncbi:MAG: hypothetical protein ACE369_13355 [Roseovarius sp.]